MKVAEPRHINARQTKRDPCKDTVSVKIVGRPGVSIEELFRIQWRREPQKVIRACSIERHRYECLPAWQGPASCRPCCAALPNAGRNTDGLSQKAAARKAVTRILHARNSSVQAVLMFLVTSMISLHLHRPPTRSRKEIPGSKLLSFFTLSTSARAGV